MTAGAQDPHARWEQLAAGFALHALQAEEEAELQAHRAACARCQAVHVELMEVAAALARAVEPAEPPPRLREAILATAAAAPEPATGSVPTQPAAAASAAADPRTPTTLAAASSRKQSRSTAGRWQRWTVPVAAAALAVVLAGGVLWWFRGHADQDTATAAIEQCQRDPGCRSIPLTASGGQPGTAIVQGQSVILVMDGLSRNDPDRDSYVLWQQQRTGAVLAAGTFDILQPVTTTPSLPLRDVQQAAALAITLEPGRAAPASPSGPILATAKL